MLFSNKRGQVTIFIIIALVIVSLAVLALVFWPKLSNVSVQESPEQFFTSCLTPIIDNAITTLSSSGGTLNSKNYLLFNNIKIDYVCYTNEYYKTCVVQRPLLKQHFSDELLAIINPQVSSCVNNLKSEMQSRGFSVSGGNNPQLTIDLSPDNSVFVVTTGLTFTKDSSTESYDSFKVSKKSDIYNLLMQATYIMSWEARYGDFDILTFMLSYPDIRADKYKLSDGSKVYILTSRNTDDSFTFATRSLSWPPGYQPNKIVGVND
ncbi:hypothetical protein COU61_00470 [Candidatus Pacearchaeota archaeon CG10_big_fil_rev_8_21_14_0_10_35_13]|nr:MAG: hypothetical protein COU61_00470 [Candidatus Pacearchaeota archaeon CG10_big_fil_rev_8_21_14_0_10_35_13]